jgi:hypothetical protein
MPDEPAPVETTDAPSTTPDEEIDPERLPGLKKAFQTERETRRALETRLKELEPIAKKVKEREEADKSELQKLNEALNAEKAARSAAELANVRHEVGLAKNVPAGLIKYLTGSTKEELEGAADDLLAQLEATGGPKVPGRPQERMSDGTPSSSALDGEDPLVLSRKARGQTTS